MKARRYLNFGCGAIFHPEWVNIDMTPVSSAVIAHDLTSGLPFPDHAFDVVYSSHVLEHLDPKAGARMLSECRRVLAPGGVCRIVVPDLADQATVYLEKLNNAHLGDAVSEAEYDWALIELIDQMVRTNSGGLMHEYLVAANLPAKEFVAERIGRGALADYRNSIDRAQTPTPSKSADWRSRLTLRRIADAILRRLNPSIGQRLDRWAMARIEAQLQGALAEATFRQTGESHRWGYDKFSLTRAFMRAGFASVETHSYKTSGVPDFGSYGLDTVDLAEERRPHSIYMEGRT